MSIPKLVIAMLASITLGVVLAVLIVNVALLPVEGTRCFPVVTLHDAYECGATH